MIIELVCVCVLYCSTVKCVRDKSGYFAERLYTSMKVLMIM